MTASLLERIDAALRQVEPMAAQSFGPALSIQRPLRWCRDRVLGVSNESPPGPLTMGLIATREFDMHGDRPELAALIKGIQRGIDGAPRGMPAPGTAPGRPGRRRARIEPVRGGPSIFRQNRGMTTERRSAARDYALQMHGGQRYGSHPYVHHLDAVAAALAPYGTEAQVVGYLHDVVEDTDATVDDVRARFGDAVAACVALLTDEPGATRKERKARTYAKLAGAAGADELALLVKAADRLANVRACTADARTGLWGVYRGEHAVFRASAFRPGQCDALWQELDALLQGDGPPPAR